MRCMRCSKHRELWFLVEGKPVRFLLREFAMVTGLGCSDKFNVTGEQATEWGNRLRDLYFDANTTIKFDDLARGFRTMSEAADKGVKKKAEKAKKKKEKPKAHKH